jgi:hypothetical protein
MTQCRTNIVQYLDKDFMEVKAAGHTRPDDLALKAEGVDGLVLLKFSHLIADLPLLPEEARQMADTLNYLADSMDPPEDE